MENWYDEIDYALEEKSRTKLRELIDELKKEYYLNIEDKNDAYHSFKNSQKTGIIDRAEKYLGLRLEDFQDKNKKEKSDFLCLVKYLYLVESYIPLLKILSKPSMDAIEVESVKSDGTDIETVEIIFDKIKKRTTSGYADRCKECYKKIFFDWLDIRELILKFIADGYILILSQHHIEKTPDEYKDIARFLEEKWKPYKTEDKIETIKNIVALGQLNNNKDDNTNLKGSISNITNVIVTSLADVINTADKDYIKRMPYTYGVFDTFYACYWRYYTSRFFNTIADKPNEGIRPSSFQIKVLL